MRLVIVAALIAPEDLSNCDTARGLFGVQPAQRKVKAVEDRNVQSGTVCSRRREEAE
jgi:hypothetical protein